MRLLAPIRLSRETDSTTSPESQRYSITGYAAEHGHEVTWCDVDLDVSGAVPIRQRPGLGPWLQPGRLGSWDIIAGHEMDRLSRDMLDYLQFARDMAKAGKTIVDVSDGTDTSTQRGRQSLEDRILAAQRERERMGERRSKAARRMADAGRWGGGRPSYGYQPSCACHGMRRCPEPEHTTGWRIAPHETHAAIVRGMVDDAIRGTDCQAIADRLNAEGHQTPRSGQRWRNNSVYRILTSPALMGHVVKMADAVVTTRRDRNGQPVKCTDEPLIDEDRYRELQRAIASRARHRGQAQARHMLWDVAFCGECGGKLYGHRWAANSRRPAFYACRDCAGMNVHLDGLERLVSMLLDLDVGDRVVREQRTIPGDDHAAEIHKLERKAERLRSELADEHDDDLASALARLEQRLAALRADHQPDRQEWVPVESGETIRQMWERLGDDAGAKNKLLRDWETRAEVSRNGQVRFFGVPMLADSDTFACEIT